MFYNRYLVIFLLIFQIICQQADAATIATEPTTGQPPSTTYFCHPDFYNMSAKNGLTLLTKFPTLQQQSEYTCGPTVILLVTQYFKGQPLQEEEAIAKAVHCKPSKGTTVKEIRNYFRKLGWQTASSADAEGPKEFKDFAPFVLARLQANTPIMVENVDWGGHWRIIIGYDTMNTPEPEDDILILADPYDLADHCQDGYVIEAARKFFYMWFSPLSYAPGASYRHWVTASPQVQN